MISLAIKLNRWHHVTVIEDQNLVQCETKNAAKRFRRQVNKRNSQNVYVHCGPSECCLEQTVNIYRRQFL
jgi:hypothetical protein